MGFVEPRRSCGFCGTKEIEELAARFDPVVGGPIDWALAAATAERAGLQLAGFARDGSLEIYVA